MTNTDYKWRTWPQIEFDNDYFDDVADWVVNRFGEDTTEVILVGKGKFNFHIAIRDPKVLNVALLKFEHCELQPSEERKDEIRVELDKAVDLEIKRLLEEVNKKLENTPTFERVKEAVKQDAYFAYENGEWNNVKD
jgi:hypothetical protein